MIGIFGGSFDPPHFGHIKSALALLEFFPFEQIRFIPCQLSPHKKQVHASGEHRLQMLNLVCKGVDELKVEDRELNRPPPSYTIDTLIELREELGDKESLVLIMGLDAFLSFCDWHRYEEILSHCHLLLLHRPGYEFSQIQQDPELECVKNLLNTHSGEDVTSLHKTPNGKVVVSELEQVDVSSTQIREMIAAGEQPRYVIPGVIWNYIKRNKLYIKP